MTSNFLDIIPPWVIYISLLIIFFLSIELGLIIGRRRGKNKEKLAESRKAQGGAVLTAIFALVAFLLAFTYSMAGAQYNARRHLIIDHANVIKICYYRAEQMPEPHRTKIRLLLREYAKIRFNVDLENFTDVITYTEQLEQQIWAEATLITQRDNSPIVSIFIQSVNQIFDIHARRLSVALWTRIPVMLILTLAFLTALSMMLYGYLIGLAHQRQDITRSFLIFAYATVFLLVIDLDRPQGGFFKISEQPMIELYNKIKE